MHCLDDHEQFEKKMLILFLRHYGQLKFGVRGTKIVSDPVDTYTFWHENAQKIGL